MEARPIFVVGTGRSGTSSVARILHENGVFMGYAFTPTNESNPQGHFEDVDFRNLNQWRLNGDISEDDWAQGIHFLMRYRDAPWGAKDPRFAHFLPDIIKIVAPRFIWCRRKLEDTIKSCMRWYGWNELEARQTIEFRDEMCRHHLGDQDVLELPIEDISEAKIMEFANG